MNKFNGPAGQKMGLGTGGGKANKGPGCSILSEPMPMKTANWPGLPGKSQPRSRSGGTEVEKAYVTGAGLDGVSDNDGLK